MVEVEPTKGWACHSSDIAQLCCLRLLSHDGWRQGGKFQFGLDQLRLALIHTRQQFVAALA